MKVEYEVETLGGWERRTEEVHAEDVADRVDELLHNPCVNYISISS